MNIKESGTTFLLTASDLLFTLMCNFVFTLLFYFLLHSCDVYAPFEAEEVSPALR